MDVHFHFSLGIHCLLCVIDFVFKLFQCPRVLISFAAFLLFLGDGCCCLNKILLRFFVHFLLF